MCIIIVRHPLVQLQSLAIYLYDHLGFPTLLLLTALVKRSQRFCPHQLLAIFLIAVEPLMNDTVKVDKPPYKEVLPLLIQSVRITSERGQPLHNGQTGCS